MGETADWGAGGMLMSPVWDMLQNLELENVDSSLPLVLSVPQGSFLHCFMLRMKYGDVRCRVSQSSIP